MITNADKHLTDQEFYTHIKFSDLILGDKEEGEETFKLYALGIGKDEKGYIFNRICLGAQLLELSVQVIRGYKFEEEIEKVTKEADKKPKEEQEKLLKIIEKIKKRKKIKIEEAGALSWIWYELYDHMEFTPLEYEIPKKIEDIFRIEMDKYLDKFIGDSLATTKKNYYKFEIQKQVLMGIIEKDKMIRLYGNNFVITEEVDESCVSIEREDFCIIQTVYALQKLGYLRVVNVWETNKYPRNSFDASNHYVNVNVILEDSFIKEINELYKKTHPENIFESFDAKRGVLKFAGKEIELSKKGKVTDPVLLLKTLLSEETSEWVHNDEILEDWGCNDEDLKKMPKNKVYFAALKINNAVALKTQIEDFIECNTSKARINPKYRKVDE